MPFSPKHFSQIFSQVLIKQGKKARAHGWFFHLAIGLKDIYRKPLFQSLSLSLSKLLPGVGIRKMVIRGKLYHLPAPIKDSRSMFVASHWLIKASLGAQRRYQSSPSDRLLLEILDLINNKPCPSLSLKEEFLSLVEDNRPFLRFIRKKRKPFRLWRRRVRSLAGLEISQERYFKGYRRRKRKSLLGPLGRNRENRKK